MWRMTEDWPWLLPAIWRRAFLEGLFWSASPGSLCRWPACCRFCTVFSCVGLELLLAKVPDPVALACVTRSFTVRGNVLI